MREISTSCRTVMPIRTFPTEFREQWSKSYQNEICECTFYRMVRPISRRSYIFGRLTVMKFFHDLLLCLFTLQINVNILLVWMSLAFPGNILVIYLKFLRWHKLGGFICSEVVYFPNNYSLWFISLPMR